MTFKWDRLSDIERFVQEEVTNQAHDFETQEIFPQNLWQKLCEEFRIFELLTEEEDLNYFRTFLEILRLLATESPSLAAIASVQGIYGILALQFFASPEQKLAYLSDLRSGKIMASFAFSEEGRDLSQHEPTTLAKETEDGWVLTGRKYMVSNAELADLILVFAETLSLDGQRGEGIFIVPRRLQGVVIEDSLKKQGMRAMPLAPVRFEEVHLLPHSLLGDELMGRQQFQTILLRKRLAISAQSLGIAQGVFKKGLADSKIKRGFGRRPIDVAINQDKFVDIEARIAACEAFYRHYIGTEMTEERSVFLLKLMTARLAKEVADEVVRITGAYSFVAGDDIDRFVKDAQVVALYGGSLENMRRRISADWLQ